MGFSAVPVQHSTMLAKVRPIGERDSTIASRRGHPALSSLSLMSCTFALLPENPRILHARLVMAATGTGLS